MNVIPEEMRNETIDYGEWKNGYRTEGMTGVAKESDEQARFRTRRNKRINSK